MAEPVGKPCEVEGGELAKSLEGKPSKAIEGGPKTPEHATAKLIR